MIAQGDEQIAVASLGDAAGDVVTARGRALLAEDDVHFVEARSLAAVEVRARHRDAAAGICVKAEIDRLVLSESAVQRDVEQAGLR